MGVAPIPHHHKPCKWDSVYHSLSSAWDSMYHSLSSAYHSETMLALKSDFRLEDMGNAARTKPPCWCGEGEVKVSGGKCCSLRKKSLCQQQVEAQGPYEYLRERRSHWRSLERDKNLTKVILGYGSLSGVSLLLGK